LLHIETDELKTIYPRIIYSLTEFLFSLQINNSIIFLDILCIYDLRTFKAITRIRFLKEIISTYKLNGVPFVVEHPITSNLHLR